jgi:hypothetical protein
LLEFKMLAPSRSIGRCTAFCALIVIAFVNPLIMRSVL